MTSTDSRPTTVAQPAATAVALPVISTIVYLMMRWSVLILLAGTGPYLVWTFIKRRTVPIRLAVVVLAALVLAAIPIDIAWARAGHPDSASGPRLEWSFAADLSVFEGS